MRHLDERAHRLAAVAFHVELLEDRLLLSGKGQPSIPQPASIGAATGAEVARAPGATPTAPEGTLAPVDGLPVAGCGVASPDDSATSGTPTAGGFGPLGATDGGPVAPADFSSGTVAASGLVANPSVLAIRHPNGDPSSPGDASSRVLLVIDPRPVLRASVDQDLLIGDGITLANALNQETPVDPTAIPVRAHGAPGIATRGGAPAGIAANAWLVGTAALPAGRPLAGGVARISMALNHARSHPGGPPAEVRALDPVDAALSDEAGLLKLGALSAREWEVTDRSEVPSPRGSGLLTDFIPFDRTTLDHAIDRFLARFEELRTDLAPLPGPSNLLTGIMAVAVALTASKVALGVLQRSLGDEADPVAENADGSRDGFAGLPEPWSFAET